MQPATCAYCGKILADPLRNGELVAFRMTVAQENYNQSHDVEAQMGHPAGADWFCHRHVAKARHFQELTLGEAMRELYQRQPFWDKMMRFIYQLIIKRR